MKRKVENNKYYQIGLTAFLVIAASLLFGCIIFKIKEVWSVLGTIIGLFTPFIVGFVFAYLLNPVVKFYKNKIFLKLMKKSKKSEVKKNKVANVLAVILACVLLVGLTVLLFSFIIPELLKSIEMIATNMPSYIMDIRNYLLEKLSYNAEIKKIILNNYDSINDFLNNTINSKLLPKVDKWLVALSNGVFGAVKVVFNTVMGFVISIYYLTGKDGFITGIKKIVYAIFPVKTANHILDNTRHTDKIFSNFLIGKLLDGFTVGFLTFLFLTIFGYRFALLIGVIVGITNMIPYFGPYIGTIPSALLILMESPTKCFIFILFIIAIQQVDSYIIEPYFCGTKTGLKSFWVLASILFFGNCFGFIGLILGVPVFALIYGYLDNKFMEKLDKKHLPTDNETYHKLDRINSETLKPTLKDE